jgi:hypothetical protein
MQREKEVDPEIQNLVSYNKYMHLIGILYQQDDTYHICSSVVTLCITNFKILNIYVLPIPCI